uniref:Sushi domain-containing protein n=1 Tax=Chromera velia CCMP2878 TaxID=1169474 RepID=A0A0G4GRE2_9ALVE|eukprot:Cvel_5093.t1-p1 / transcript=Cvel_5093.t1 / gene=Cvel_5093 / organism=Chromera_velia_CCMP2878 / gene_product=hypothetical protein / transcript_product=hypothetical protein / location=Cvel_scaffold232:82227-107847(+) / protein_length=1429 / sequence_SO=supercontig / SO=protein_coding / is_pseudo=false
MSSKMKVKEGGRTVFFMLRRTAEGSNAEIMANDDGSRRVGVWSDKEEELSFRQEDPERAPTFDASVKKNLEYRESGQFSLAIYRDGKLELDGEGTPLDVGDVSSSSTAGNIAIGCDPTGKNCFSGSISLLYLIKEAKTKEEIDTYQKEVIDSNMLGRCNEELGYHAIEGFPENEILTCEHGHFPPKIIVCEDDLDIAGLVVEGEVKDISKTGAQHTVVCDESRGFRSTDGREKEFVSCIDTQWTDITLKCARSRDYSPLVLPGKETLRCVNGLWTPRSLRCERPCPEYDATATPQYEVQKPSGAAPFPHGTAMKVMCAGNRTDTRGNTEMTNYCYKGNWPEPVLDCQYACPAFPDLGPGHEISGSGATHGSSRVLSCSEGYSDVANPDDSASSETVYCSFGKWGAVGVQCKASCKELDLKYPMEDKSKSETAVTHGTRKTVGCKGEDDKNEEIVCVDGKWSLHEIKCSFKGTAYPDPGPAYSYEYSNISHASLASGGDHNEVVIKCADGFNSTNPDKQEETLGFISSIGQWQDRTLICEAVCEPYLPPSSLYEVVPDPEGEEKKISTDLRSGASRFVQCKFMGCDASKYVLQLARLVTVSEGDDKNPPEVSLNSAYTLVDGNENVLIGKSAEGSYAIVGCGNGYVHTSGTGEEKVECINGHVPEVTLKCESTCPVFHSPCKHGKTCQYRVEGQGEGPGDKRTITCGSGFAPVAGPDSEEVECIDGDWTPFTIKCDALCPKFEASEGNVQVLSDVEEADIKRHGGNESAVSLLAHTKGGAVVEVGCDNTNNFGAASGIDQEELMCSHGAWSKQGVRCQKGCNDPPHFSFPLENAEDGTDTYKGQSYGSMRLGKCMEPTRTTGDFKSVLPFDTEPLYCREGKFSYPHIECAIACDGSHTGIAAFLDTLHLDSPRFKIEAPEKPVPYGGVVNISCIEGYSDSTGETKDQLRCAAGGKYVAPSLECEAMCTELPKSDSRRVIWDTSEGSLLHGATRRIDCAFGMEAIGGPLTGSQQVVCRAGLWNSPTKACAESCDEGAHGSKMQKMCHETESSVTTPKTLDITCLDGEYPADVVECEKNCDFSQVDVPEGVMIMGDVGQGRNGQNVTAVCNDSYVSVSEMMKVESVFCWKGLWDTIELRCMRKCEKIEAPEGYVFHYEENDRTLSVHCEKGFHSPNNKHAESKQHVKCLNGKWAEIGLSCQPELILRERKLSAESSYVIWNPQREGSYDSNPHYNLFVRRPLMAFPSTPEDKVKGIGMFYSLGDFFSEDGEQPEEGPFIAAGMVVAPDSFELVWQSDEKPSRTLLEPEYTVLGEEASELLPNDHNSLTLWRGVPPKGFVCLGLVASREKHSPSKDSMRCVPNRCMHVLPKEDTELVYELTPKVRIMRPKSGPDVADDVKKLAWLHAVPFQEKEEEDFKEFRTLKLDCLHMEL